MLGLVDKGPPPNLWPMAGQPTPPHNATGKPPPRNSLAGLIEGLRTVGLP